MICKTELLAKLVSFKLKLYEKKKHGMSQPEVATEIAVQESTTFQSDLVASKYSGFFLTSIGEIILIRSLTVHCQQVPGNC